MTAARLPALRPQWAAALAKTLVLAVMPSFLSDLTNPERRRRSSPRLHPTSYLDGLRGLAACAVFAYHYTDYNHKPLLPHYGSNPEDVGSTFIQLPYFRLIYSGTPMVHIFFVISGFALSFRPIRTLYNSTTSTGGPDSSAIAKCHAIISSSAFRRPFRLFLPPMITTFLTGCIIQLGYMNKYMQPQETLREQFYDWFSDVFQHLTYPWAWDEGSPKARYNPHLWTIPMEFVHSMFLFLIVVVGSRLRSPLVRQAFFATVMGFTIYSGRWAAFEFIGGTLLADLFHSGQQQQHEHQPLPPSDPEKADLITPLQDGSLSGGDSHCRVRRTIPRVCSCLLDVFRVLVLLGAGFILSWPPRTGDMTETYTWIQSLAPQYMVGDKPERGKNFWLAIAAFATVWASGRISLFKRVLNHPISQYAGRISFCFYILQHPVLNLMQHNLLGAEAKAANGDQPAELPWGIRGMTGIQTPFQRTICWLMGLVIIGSVLVWLSDLFTRMVDAPAVKFARWVEAKCFAKEDTQEKEMQK